MRRNINSVHLEGWLYQHELSEKTVQNKESANFGKPFIQGTIYIATDAEALNVVPVYYSYVTPVTAKGKTNSTYNLLKKIIDEPELAWVESGYENALPLIVNSSIALNEFYVEENGESSLVSAKRAEGGFLSSKKIAENKSEEERNRFEADMLITNIKHIEANEEKQVAEHILLSGAIFNFKNDLLPISFKVTSEDGIKYFDQLTIEPASPLYTNVWGTIQSSTIVETKETKAAFGKSAVQTTTRTLRDWIITAIADISYDYGEEDVLTAEDIQKMMQTREVMLAEKKAQREEYLKTKDSGTTGATPINAAPAPKIKSGKFLF